MRPAQRAVLRELAELDRLDDDQQLNGWWRAFHVRYYREQNPMAEKGVPLESVKTDLRHLAAAGLVERKAGKAALYRISDQGRRALQGEMIDEDTRHKMVELSIPADAPVAQLVQRIGQQVAEIDRLRRQIEREWSPRLEKE